MVNQDTLKTGDVVQLMSSGAKMTVRRPRATNLIEGEPDVVLCDLISDAGELSYGSYLPEMLKLADNEGSTP